MCIEFARLPRNLRIYTCTHVFHGARAVRLVVHSPDGDISMLCGENDHSTDPLDFHGVGLGHILNRDASISAIPPLPRGFEAERMTKDAKWDVRRLPQDVD